MTDTLTIAIGQVNATPDIDANLSAIAAQSRQAAEQGASAILFPECATLMCPDREKIDHAEPVDGTQVNFCAEIASTFKIAMLLGSFAELSDETNRVYNTSVWIDSRGKRVATYRKAHLFDVDLSDGSTFRESDHVIAGAAEPVIVEHEGWRFGLSICYDLRFPEFYRAISSQGCDVICVPAAFTYRTGASHWEPLLRARAIENLAYVVAPAQTGLNYGKRECWGHSMAVSPWGEVIAQRGFEPGVTLVTLERKLVDHARAQIPALRHRRL